jgi:large subunit ribosomal protein L10
MCPFLFLKFLWRRAMGMNRAEKETEIQELAARFSSEELVVVAHYSGMTVTDLSNFRAELRKEEASFKVTKNTLAKVALKGTKFEGIAPMLKGPTGVATSKDPFAAARVTYNFAKKNDKLIILGGAMGDKILDAKAVETLAKLPTLNELRSKIVGLLQAPARALVGVTKAYGEKV